MTFAGRIYVWKGKFEINNYFKFQINLFSQRAAPLDVPGKADEHDVEIIRNEVPAVAPYDFILIKYNDIV